MGVAAVLWGIWKARNLACFNHKWPVDPSVVMFRVAYWITDWSVLQVSEDTKPSLLEQVAAEVYGAKRSWAMGADAGIVMS